MISRFDYVAYDAEAALQQAELKNIVQDLETKIYNLGLTEYTDDAIKQLEIFYMYCGKIIRDQQILRNGSAPLQEARKDS